MQIDALALRMRPRAPLEAADLGARLCQDAARSVYACYAVAYLPVVALAFASFEIAAWLPTLVLFCAKPWLDRTILFVLSRAAFGQAHDAAPTVAGAAAGVVGPVVPHVDVAALVAVAFVHATRLPARRATARPYSATSQTAPPPQSAAPRC